MTKHVMIEASSLDEHNRRIEAMERRIERLCAALESVRVEKEPEWLTVKEYAAKFDISTRTVSRKIDAGELRARGAGKTRQVKV